MQRMALAWGLPGGRLHGVRGDMGAQEKEDALASLCVAVTALAGLDQVGVMSQPPGLDLIMSPARPACHVHPFGPPTISQPAVLPYTQVLQQGRASGKRARSLLQRPEHEAAWGQLCAGLTSLLAHHFSGKVGGCTAASRVLLYV